MKGIRKGFEYNIIFAHLAQVFIAFGFAWGVIQIIHFQHIGLSFTNIALIFSIWQLIPIFFEVPTGIFADRFGRRPSVLLAFGLYSIGMLVLAHANDLNDVILFALISGLSSTFWSGAFDSILFESLEKESRDQTFQTVLSRMNFIYITITAIAVYTIPQIYDFQKDLPFYLSSLIFAILAVLGLFLKENLISKQPIHKKILKHLSLILSFIFKRPRLLTTLLFSISAGVCISIFATLLNQPLIIEKYDLSDYATFFAVATIAQALFSFFSDKIVFLFRKTNYHFSMMLSWAFWISLSVFLLDHLFISAIFMGIAWTHGGITHIVMSSDTNKSIKINSLRSSINSTLSMFSALSMSISSILFGIFFDSFGLYNAFSFLIILIILSGLLTSIFFNKIKSQK